jgi:5-methylcytosine-specific restriction protein A
MRGQCDTCGPREGSSHARGYGHHWRTYRLWWLSDHPYCGDRMDGYPGTGDSACASHGQQTLGTQVDHIRQVTGADDPSFFDSTGHQTLCRSCHQSKSQRDHHGAHR